MARILQSISLARPPDRDPASPPVRHCQSVWQSRRYVLPICSRLARIPRFRSMFAEGQIVTLFRCKTSERLSVLRVLNFELFCKEMSGLLKWNLRCLVSACVTILYIHLC
ncbi:unnamed protein product [Chrysodeixis includens]|uniref:Uncharacterized protein n=1 Tax=Chrysodeixis includens TaxID=689277 RepID=A0A9P0FVG2_CHRIL|nr:unnamed protein product [Chrysodeixis includens]